MKLVKKLEVITKRVLEEKKNENNSQDFSGIFISIYFLKRLLNIRSLRNSIFKLYRDVVPQLVEVLEQKQKDLIVAKSESSISQEEKTKNDTNSALLVRHAYFLAAASETVL